MTLDLVAMPKAELHVHVEATLSRETAAELAARYDLQVPSIEPFESLAVFVGEYERARDLIGTLDDLTRVAREFGERQRADGVTWTEVYCIPSTYAGRLGSDDEVVGAVVDGLRAGAGDNAAGVIIGINRGLPDAQATLMTELAGRWLGSGVVGLGLAGDEAQYPGRLFVTQFARARALGLPAVPHAGEARGPESIADAIELLSARRISHGLTALADRDVMRQLMSRQICLDMAPSSNVLLSGVADLGSHPFPDLLRQGIPVTINSDCPYFAGHGLVREYEICAQAWELTDTEILDIAATSIKFALCPESVRVSALNNLEALRSSK